MMYGTVKMVKGNREMTIDITQKQDFLKRGFSVIDENGQVIESGKASELDLKKQIEELKKENKSLKAKITRLEKKTGELQGETGEPLSE